jgi:hypothetical protein
MNNDAASGFKALETLLRQKPAFFPRPVMIYVGVKVKISFGK